MRVLARIKINAPVRRLVIADSTLQGLGSGCAEPVRGRWHRGVTRVRAQAALDLAWSGCPRRAGEAASAAVATLRCAVCGVLPPGREGPTTSTWRTRSASGRPGCSSYRMHQLFEMFGDRLNDPDFRFEVEAALGARALLAT